MSRTEGGEPAPGKRGLKALPGKAAGGALKGLKLSLVTAFVTAVAVGAAFVLDAIFVQDGKREE